MVFEYLEYDLWALANSPQISLTPTHIKTYMKQMLDAIAYMHTNKVRSGSSNHVAQCHRSSTSSPHRREIVSDGGSACWCLRVIVLMRSSSIYACILYEETGALDAAFDYLNWCAQASSWSIVVLLRSPLFRFLLYVGYAPRPQVRKFADRS